MSSPAADTAVPHVALWGSDHPELGRLAVESLPPATAVALSAGRLPKPYAHLDANEDAILAAHGPVGTLLAVADGHSGFDAARAAIAAIREHLDALSRAGQDPSETVESLLVAARQGVREGLADADHERRQSRTALTVALVSGHELISGGWGDTQVLRIRGRRAKVLSGDGPFLDGAAVVAGVARNKLRGGDFVLVCSDGLRDYLAGGWPDGVHGVLRTRPQPTTAVQALVEAAWAGGAGDHIAVGLIRGR